MQRGFTKLFNTIVTSTIWQEDDKTRIVWITMLAIADADGIVSASIPGLASVSNVSNEAADNAIQNLKAPDGYSRTKEFEGRRIEEIDGGWRILNHDKYRRMLSTEERKEYKAKWEREKRKKSVDKRGQRVDSGGQNGLSPSASSSTSSSVSTDEQWLQSLEQDPTYKGIDVQREYGKMKIWCSVNNKQPTRRRFIRWINNAEKPMDVKDQPKKQSTGEAKWI